VQDSGYQNGSLFPDPQRFTQFFQLKAASQNHPFILAYLAIFLNKVQIFGKSPHFSRFLGQNGDSAPKIGYLRRF
jgi:hypothetical protein